MREGIIRLLQRQYRNYRDFLIEIDDTKEAYENLEKYFCFYDSLEKEEKVTVGDFDIDSADAIYEFLCKYSSLCYSYSKMGCWFFKRRENIILSCFYTDDNSFCGKFKEKIVFKERDFLDFCFGEGDWKKVVVLHYEEESLLEQYKVFSQNDMEAIFLILKRLCSIITEFDKNELEPFKERDF